MWLGKYSDAIDHLKMATVLSRTAGEQLSEMRNRLYLAKAYLAKGMTAPFETEMAAATALEKAIHAGPIWLLRIGRIFAREGRIAEAERLLSEVAECLGDPFTSAGVSRWQRSDQAANDALRGELELARRNYDEALRLFELSYGILGDEYAESIALCQLARGHLDEALERFREFVGKTRSGDEAQEYWLLAHYQMGEIYEQKGDSEKALQYYQKLQHIWKEGDPDLIPLVRLRRKLAELKAEVR